MKISFDAKLFIFIVALALLPVCSGCGKHKPYKTPEFPLLQDKFENSQATEVYKESGKWWQGFQSSQLDLLVEQAFQKNRSLKILQADIEQKLAAFNIVSASVFPALSAGASMGRSQSIVKNSDGSYSTDDSDSFSFLLNATYDLDIFDSRSSAVSAAELEIAAAMEDYKSRLFSVAEEVVKNWLNVIENLSQIKLSEQTLAANEANLKLVSERYQLGTTPLSDVFQAQQQVFVTQSQIPLAKEKMVTTQYSIALSVGEYPKALIKDSTDLPFDKLPQIATGLPSGLIKRRPDIRASLARIRIADQNVAKAIAERFPAIRLRASLGKNPGLLKNLITIDSLLWSLVGDVALTIIDAGEKKAAVKQQEAVLRERILTYQSVLYNAFKEVEENLAMIEQREKHVELIKKRIELSEQSLQLTKLDYINGLTDWLNVMTIQTQFYDNQKALITSQKNLSDLKVALLSALGGAWPDQYINPQYINPYQR